MLTQPLAKNNEPEAREATPLYPMMLESPELRWAFIRKVYSILAVQLLATIVVAVAVASVPQLTRFFVSTIAGLVLFIVIILAAALGNILIKKLGSVLSFFLCDFFLYFSQCYGRCLTITRSIR